MAQLVYSEAELLAEDDYARPQENAGYRLHGGYDGDGNYISPRTKYRWPAVRAWTDAFVAAGGELVEASPEEIIKRPHAPIFEQQCMLLNYGLGQTLWNSLTVTGIIEARGQNLANAVLPDFQKIIEEDISDTATGHLAKGLFKAHGWDEGGVGDVGAHDAMWFAARDLVFGKDAYPLPPEPPTIGRSEKGRVLPLLPEHYESVLMTIMNVLLIEVRAESGFDFNVRLMRNPDLFTDRRKEAEQAADLVDRIRQDELIHVSYLQLVLSEMRTFTFKLAEGARVKGHTFIDPVWAGLVKYHGITVFDDRREQVRAAIGAAMEKHPKGAEIMAQYDTLGNAE